MTHRLSAPLASIVVVAGAVCASSACGPSVTAQHPIPKPVASTSSMGAPPPDHPARWALHPASPSPLHARVDLGATGVLYAGDDGERWLDREGTPIVASSLLPDSIAAVGRSAESFLFVSTTGTVYVVASSDPLGPAIATHAPPKPMRSIGAGKKAILGVADGALLRSTDAGATWAQVTIPAVAGTMTQVAMRANGDGLLLFSPQRVMATTDDGATWTAVPTPGVGARRVVADANGDLMLEGLQASGILRVEPLRLEKIARAPAGDPDLPMPAELVAPGYARALQRGNAALVGKSYYEFAQTQSPTDDGMHWSFGASTLTDAPKLKLSSTFDLCANVLLAGSQPTPTTTILEAACVHEPTPNPNGGPPTKKISDHWNARLFRSDDEGKTWRPDGASYAVENGARRLWIGPDGTTLIDGACKWSKNDWSCEESPPLVRAPGAQSFAKVIGQPWTLFSDVVFTSKGRAYALGVVNRNGRIGLYVSSDGGKDFARKALPATSEKKDGSGEALVPEYVDWPTSVTVDETTGAVLAAVSATGRFVVYETRDDGTTFDARVLPFERIDQVQLAGRHGLAWSSDGKSYETSDGGVTWSEAEAPHAHDSKTELACNEYACFLGDLATRIGWNDAPAKATDATPKTKKTPKSLSPITCTPLGAWSTVAPASSGVVSSDLPDARNFDLGPAARFTMLRNEKDGSVVAMVGGKPKDKAPDDKIELKDVTLFGPAAKDTAVWATMQIEGVAALRYSFKRDAPTSKKPGAAPWAWGPVKKDQVVDVEVAWFLAADGKVHHATIKGAGPLQPTDLWDGRDKPSTARTSMLSIAMGGIHVRPFMTSKPDAPLYFISDAGKIETLTWPELPNKDVRGRVMPVCPSNSVAGNCLTVDSVRVGKRSFVFGYQSYRTPLPPNGLQLVTAWSSGAAATSWDVRTWGLWPQADPSLGDAIDLGAVALRYVDSGPAPAFVVSFDGHGTDASASWLVPLKAPEADPSGVIAVPTASSLGDAPRACGKADAASWRLTVPASLGARHPIVVGGDVEATMATREAVVRAPPTGTDACVSAWDAAAVGAKKTMETYSAVLPWDDLAHSALFRTKSGDISARAMRCTMEPGGALPAAFKGIEGFGD